MGPEVTIALNTELALQAEKAFLGLQLYLHLPI
jgi:hypothetical protein